MEIRFECVAGPCEGQLLGLGCGQHRIGRGPDNEVRLADDEAASLVHAILHIQPRTLLIEDRASHNGTWLNGVRLAVPTVVSFDDTVRIGGSEWRAHPRRPEEATVEGDLVPLVIDPSRTAELDEPRLQVLTGEHRGKVFELRSGQPFVVGRGSRADLALDDAYVSREHATFFRQGEQVAVLDNESSNGVLVNGDKIRMIHLQPGDRIRIGETDFLLIGLGDEVPPLPEPPPLEEEISTEEAPSIQVAGFPRVTGERPLGRLGDYELLGELGRGGMGRVFAGQRADGELVALKVVLLKGLSDERVERRRRRFEREVKVLRRIRHDNVVAYRGAGVADGRPYLAMECLDGPDLATVLRQAGRLPYREVERLLFQLCSAVSAVHEAGVIHRDLKPANVVIHGPQRTVKLTDFGIARPVGEQDLEGDEERLAADVDQEITGAGRHPGTPLYMAPEQIRGEALDMRSDIWALGVMLYQLVSGKRPFEGAVGGEVKERVEHDRPAPLPDEVPAHVRSAVYRCLLKPAGWRFASAIELMDALHERRVEQLVPLGDGAPEPVPPVRCPYCQARIAAGRDRCPICQADLLLFRDGQMLQLELESKLYHGCGGCGQVSGLTDSVCIRCGHRFAHRRAGTAMLHDDSLTEHEAERLALGLARLKRCPHCASSTDRRRPSCGQCGLNLKAWLIGRIKVGDPAGGGTLARCGNCGLNLPSIDLPLCPSCGLNFTTGRLRGNRRWHAAPEE